MPLHVGHVYLEKGGEVGGLDLCPRVSEHGKVRWIKSSYRGHGDVDHVHIPIMKGGGW